MHIVESRTKQITLEKLPLLFLTVNLQLLKLRRFGPSAAFDNDLLIVQQSEIRSLKQVKT